MATPIDSAGQANSFADAFQLGAGAVRVWLEIMVTNTTGMMHGFFLIAETRSDADWSGSWGNAGCRSH
jgi:hypothetical protein